MGKEKVDLGLLRELTAFRAEGVCEWAGCSEPGAEMAHLLHRGMGGNPSQDRNVLANTVWLCQYHHDILDRRRSQGTREAIRELLTGYLKVSRESRGLAND